ncbi:MAG TPA: tyrosine-type recombinase/integrase [Stellaceae bacterium]|nr:tyrosine-type recombinase/integrase [Stellaceae bacterium]
MTIHQRTGSPNWMIEFQYLGQKVRRSSATPSRSKARELEQQWRREIHDRVAAGKLPTISLADAIDRYYQTVLLPQGKPKTRAKDLYTLNKLRTHFGADTPLDGLTPTVIAQYSDDLIIKQKLAQSSANREIGYIRAILNKAEDRGVSAARWRTKTFEEPRGRVRWLLPDEEARLLEECADHIRPIVAFLMDSGCRREEALQLTWKQVVFEPDRVRILIDADVTKNDTAIGKLVLVRTATILRNLYATRPKKQRRVFQFDGKPLGNFRAGFEAACRRAGIENFKIHDLRHHYASRLVQKGVSLQRVQTLLGHKSSRMTERCAHLAPSDLDDAVLVLDG